LEIPYLGLFYLNIKTINSNATVKCSIVSAGPYGVNVLIVRLFIFSVPLSVPLRFCSLSSENEIEVQNKITLGAICYQLPTIYGEKRRLLTNGYSL